MRQLALLIAPLLVVAAIELAFRAGVWEPIAKPTSHAGTSVRLKRALLDPAVARLDFVTIGSSRPEYGIDHARVAAAAREQGFVHANLSMPGAHWMSVAGLLEWLAARRTDVRGGVIALSVSDFAYAGNGDYELGVLSPFRQFGDERWLGQHVPFERGNLASWGADSLLFAYREDVFDLLRHPRERYAESIWYRREAPRIALFERVAHQGTICGVDLSSAQRCVDTAGAAGDNADIVRGQCAQLNAPAQRANYALAADVELPPHMALLQQRVRAILTGTRWEKPPVMLLMPLHRVWLDQVGAAGLHAWALRVLQPLADAGKIVLLDYTDFLLADGSPECASYWDIYHQNDAAQSRLTDALLPQLRQHLYGPALPPAAAVAAPAAGAPD